MAEMERVYGGWPLGPKAELEFVWGEYTDDGPGVDFEVDVSMVDESMAAWDRERRTTDNGLDQHPDLDELCHPGRRVRWTLQKLVGEYARHNGHADLIRESIDGRTGE
jgi:hypothetical protein